LLCIHFSSVMEALRANELAMQFNPSACELMDHYILDCTKDNIEQRKNRFFVQGNPAAILMVEFVDEDSAQIEIKSDNLIAALKRQGLGYHYPLVRNQDCARAWELRKAGLGLLGNMSGDEKAVAVIEDTAVALEDLADYIQDFNTILKKHDLYSVHYAHAGAGELHLRPIINLKTQKGNELFRTIATEIASLVKKYQGSLSGEHGDGRLRGEFLPRMVGHKNYALFKSIKALWDPHCIFNPGKIVDTPPMDTQLRYKPEQSQPEIKTIFRFQGQNILQHAEQCNGSGDCRKLQIAGGTMCPSYMATRNEKDTTRGRANVLREFLTHSEKANRFDHPEINEVMDLCISCKGCKAECPSNVDMAKLKAEFLQHYYDANGATLRSKIVASYNALSSIGTIFPSLYNWIAKSPLPSFIGFSSKRQLPLLYKTTLHNWFKRRAKPNADYKRKVYFFCDEFSNYNDTEIAIKAILLLEHLGYEVQLLLNKESGRTCLSKGFLRKAKEIANDNVRFFSKLVNQNTPLIGLEPSAILTFRDEYLDLVDEALLPLAKTVASHTFLIDEFLSTEIDAGNINSSSFWKNPAHIKLHTHCHQKAISSTEASRKCLALPENYTVEVIPSGCCGMAGSFGMEKEHYDISMQIGELILFPAIRQTKPETIIAATGTSCRHQIHDGTSRKALHPVEILYEALA
jgi:Fe-S oxidoreductase